MNVKIKQGVQSLGSLRPDLVGEWHPTLNFDLTPFDIAGKSTSKAWWLCDKGHAWEAPVLNRSRRGDGCPVCSGRQVEPGVNDLETVNPALASQWHPILNGAIRPRDVKSKSGKKVWWLCSQGHSFECSVATRASGVGCGKCYRQGLRSAAERPKVTVSDIPEMLESFDWQENPGENPEEISAWSSEKIRWRCLAGHQWSASPTSRFRKGRVVGCRVCSGRDFIPGVNDLASLHPLLADEFDEIRNAPLSFSAIPPGSKGKFWWLCSQGHSYNTSLASRRHNGTGCPVCRNQKVLVGVNDMASTHPDLASELDPERNAPDTPHTLVAGVRKKLWWLCPLGHSYSAAGYTRINGSGCPICINKRVLSGFNDLATTHPGLASEFDLERNAGLKPSEINAGTHKKIWWICERQHSYQASGMKRVGEGTGCPTCANRKILTGFNDMASLAPQLVKHFHPTKNAPDTPYTLSPRTNRTLWWLCERGHEYAARPGNRLQPGGIGCPVCSNHRVLAGYNDLATTRPDLLDSWHPSKNGSKTPEMFLPGSNKKVWWICPEGHEWFAYINLRSRGSGCPRCTKGGFDSSKPGWLYFISSHELGARKIGISNFEVKRLAEYEAHWATVKLWNHGSGLAIAQIETQTLNWLRKVKGMPQYLGREEMGQAGGFTETFSFDGVSDFEVITYIEELFLKLDE